jgi:hypothetical protein
MKKTWLHVESSILMIVDLQEWAAAAAAPVFRVFPAHG